MCFHNRENYFKDVAFTLFSFYFSREYTIFSYELPQLLLVAHCVPSPEPARKVEEMKET